jgi:hypothetical protein
VANGNLALFSNTIGENNTAVGAVALLSNTEGGSNTANGDGALAKMSAQLEVSKPSPQVVNNP